MIKTVIFDMDGVLIDTESICAVAWRESAKTHQIADIETTIRECIGLNEADTKSYFLNKYGRDFAYDNFKIDSSNWFYEIAKSEGVAVKPGVYELMEYLKKSGYRIGLASSSRKQSVEFHMERADLLKYFEVVVSGDMVKHSKPNPEIYQIACGKMGVDPSQVYAVEDSFNGIRAAYQAGMKVIMIPDMVAPTDEIRTMLHGCYETLNDWRQVISGNGQANSGNDLP